MKSSPVHLFVYRVLPGVLLTWGVLAQHSIALAGTDGRISAFEYDPVSGLLTKEIVEPDLPQLRLETSTKYNQYGKKVETTISSPATGSAAIIPRTATMQWGGSYGDLPANHTNALGQHTYNAGQDAYGNLTSTTSTNGLSTTWQYDIFGRKTMETRPDGTQTKWEYLYCSGYNGGTASCPALATYLVQAQPLAADGTANGPWQSSYYDALDRVIEADTVGFDGSTVIAQLTEYDFYGRTARTSLPHFKGKETPLWATNHYDDLDRVVVADAPDGTQTTFGYNGLISTVTNPLHQTQTKRSNGIGRVMEVIDADGNHLYFTYDPFGNLSTTQDAKGNLTKLYYDQRGRKTDLIDPAMGHWLYGYNVLGEMIAQTDAKGQASSMRYDQLGRVTQRTEADLVSTWTYDNCAKGIGQLCRAATDRGYSRDTSYDSLGRAISSNTVIDSTHGAFASAVTYDANGRIATHTYPGGFVLNYDYTALGDLQNIKGRLGQLYWRLVRVDAQGHFLSQMYNSNLISQTQGFNSATGQLNRIQTGLTNSAVQDLSYRYDDGGNLIGRTDLNQHVDETFAYDRLNRVTHATVTNSSTSFVQDFTYDSVGNVSSRSDVGTYHYAASSNRLNNITLQDGSNRNFSYDVNGTVTSEIKTDAQGIANRSSLVGTDYNSFNMPKALHGQTVSLDFTYGPEHQRITQVTPDVTTIYLNPDNSGSLFYEKDIKADGSVEQRNFITAYGQVVAVAKQDATIVDRVTNYYYRDPLGSTTAMTGGGGSAVIERLSYEPFGKRRFIDGSSDPGDSLAGVNTTRGYTNHEHLEQLGLIHMNGRIYDPAIGRFMSADPYVQSPDNLQSYNRYAYVLNNPLLYGDPSGYWSLGHALSSAFHAITHVVEHVVQQVVNAAKPVIVAAIIPTPKNVFDATKNLPGQGHVDSYIENHQWAGMVGQTAATVFTGVCGGCGGAIWDSYYAYVGTGSMSAAYKAGAITYGTSLAFNGVGSYLPGPVENVAGHALVGCASAAAGGGSCKAGAFAGAAGGALGSSGNFGVDLAAHMVVGGTASAIGGGSFSNGAKTAAYGYIFNDWAHNLEQMAYGREAHQIFQEQVKKYDGFETERTCTSNNLCVNGRFDIANGEDRELWEIKKDNILGRATGEIALQNYTSGTNFKRGGDLPNLVVGEIATYGGNGADYSYLNAGNGLVLYGRQSTSPGFKIKMPQISPFGVPGGFPIPYLIP